MTSQDCAFRLISTEWTKVEELTSNHEKADTKMLLYAKYATILHGNLFICIQGTVTFIITPEKIIEVAAHIQMLAGTRNNGQITDINGFTENVDTSLNMTDYSKEKILLTLAGIHCFKAFDTITTFPGQI